jgi:hypothetical protein
VRAPKANVIAERFVRTDRADCLDWLLILSRWRLEQILRVFVNHYSGPRRTGPSISARRIQGSRRSDQSPRCDRIRSNVEIASAD